MRAWLMAAAAVLSAAASDVAAHGDPVTMTLLLDYCMRDKGMGDEVLLEPAALEACKRAFVAEMRPCCAGKTPREAGGAKRQGASKACRAALTPLERITLCEVLKGLSRT